MRLSDFRVLSFDCYGTLIDWETGISRALESLRARADRPLTRDQLLEAHARHEAAQEAETPACPYRDVLAKVYARIAREWGVEATPGEALAYGQSIGTWPAFADSPEALAYLKHHYKLAILSNVDRESFRASNLRLGVEFDFIFTAEDIGSYKPDPRNFEYLLRELGKAGFAREAILHTAESLFHDHEPANRFGLASAWIHRRAGREGHGATHPPASMPRYDYKFDSMAAMVAAHQEASC